MACTFCTLRLDRRDFGAWRDFERRIGVRNHAVEELQKLLTTEALAGAEWVLGAGADPWQAAEERFRLTRSILAVLAGHDGLCLHVRTRASLIARDTDLLQRLAERGRVTVTFSIASLDERINRLLEPRAPSVFRRLAAMEALARVGLTVGLEVSPVMPGLDEDELGLASLLTRAANAGARFAGYDFLHFAPGQRENFLAHVTTAYPERAVRFRRVIGRKPPSEEERAQLGKSFRRLCADLGLVRREDLGTVHTGRAEAWAQLGLFDAALDPA